MLISGVASKKDCVFLLAVLLFCVYFLRCCFLFCLATNFTLLILFILPNTSNDWSN